MCSRACPNRWRYSGLFAPAAAAAAWAITPEPGSDGFTIVQGTDRAGHPADQFSDDHTDLVGSSLHLISGKTIGWKYTDGTKGTQALF